MGHLLGQSLNFAIEISRVSSGIPENQEEDFFFFDSIEQSNREPTHQDATYFSTINHTNAWMVSNDLDRTIHGLNESFAH